MLSRYPHSPCFPHLSDASAPFGIQRPTSPESVLYNFEHVPRRLPRSPPTDQSGRRGSSLVSRDTLKIYASYTLWEYAENNLNNLLAMGIKAKLVPLGFSSELVSRLPGNGGQGPGNLQDEQEFIDVLFVGTETPVRQATIRRIRDAGITVIYPNPAEIEPFGADFDAISAKSKIVLSLNAFASTPGNCAADASCNHGEWKIARIARLLANSR